MSHGNYRGTIGQLAELTTLNLKDNQLTELPETIGQLTSLETLDLSSNELTELPETIGQLMELKELNLEGISSRNYRSP